MRDHDREHFIEGVGLVAALLAAALVVAIAL
jgi:hypothetical protein